MDERLFLYTDPGERISFPQQPVLYRTRIVQQRMTKAPEVIAAVMKIEICHFRIAQRRIIGEGLSFLGLQIDGFVKRTVDDMDLSSRLQLGQRKMNYLFQVREILD